MILDTSAVVALFFAEPGYREILDKIGRADAVGMGTPTLVETGIVLAARLGHDPRPLLARFLAEAEVVEVPFGPEHLREAISAYLRFGKGRHPAALNFGDCMTYAVARLAERPLLCVGDDFSLTDLEAA